MSSVLVFSLPGFAILAMAIVIPVLFRLYRRSSLEEITPEWLESFSATTYEPMQRLLNAEDFNFLKRQPGYDLAVVQRLRRERLRIFRQYLNRVVVDFNRLHLAARILVAHSQEDRSALLSHLMALKFRFGLAAIQAEFNYMLCCIGYSTISVRALLARLEEMSTQLNALSTANAAAY